ncbi:uncharacterized protein LOC128856319 isoform X1 [Anastrepha ludens]|uniref:uncharacterized protein LOC128856319 isoform X1 n=1 Tax=Anastrepha ludens TaxID=28586 RepID=UPI0023AF9517|nr:uncharacterized protein LOC128856319 isoform X1 [Anastrepha ludens]
MSLPINSLFFLNSQLFIKASKCILFESGPETRPGTASLPFCLLAEKYVAVVCSLNCRYEQINKIFPCVTHYRYMAKLYYPYLFMHWVKKLVPNESEKKQIMNCQRGVQINLK